MSNKTVSELTYAEAVQELEKIVADLDQGTIDIDNLSDQFQRAINIIEELDQRIARTKEQVERLAPRLDAIGKD